MVIGVPCKVGCGGPRGCFVSEHEYNLSKHPSRQPIPILCWMSHLPLALTMELMKVSFQQTIFRDLDGYCGRYSNFATALNAAFVSDLSRATLARDHRFVLRSWGA
jgi:hypothetical protein